MVSERTYNPKGESLVKPTQSPTEIEGLVSRLQAVTCHKSETDSLTVAKLCHEAADALSQTIPRTTDEGMREIYSKVLSDRGLVPFAQPNEAEVITLECMRRVSKTDEAVDDRVNLKQDLVQEGVFIWKQWNANIKDHGGNVNLLMSRVYDLFAEELLKFRLQPAKTDEGRNAVIEEAVSVPRRLVRDYLDWLAEFEANGKCPTADAIYPLKSVLEAALTTGGK